MPRRRARPARGAPSSPSCRLPDGLVDRLPEVVFRVRLSPRPRLEYVNRAVLALSGYPPDRWCTDPALALHAIHASDKRKLQDIARSGRVPAHPLQVRWTRRDGAVVRTEITLVPLHGRQGNITAIDGVARDVTGAAEAATHAGERPLRDVFEQLPLGVARIAADGRLLLVNHRICDLTGFDADELLSRRFRDIVHPDDGESVSAVLQQVRTSDVPHAVAEHRVACKNGSSRWVKLTVCRLRNAADGQSVAVVEPIVGPPADREGDRRRLSYGGIDVDTDRLEVSWNGRHVSVTLKEVLLLRYLIRHRGEMLARDRLLKDVWGYEHAGRSRTLDVHVCRLRRKLPPLADSLATIGHFGYTLAAQMTPGEAAGAS